MLFHFTFERTRHSGFGFIICQVELIIYKVLWRFSDNNSCFRYHGSYKLPEANYFGNDDISHQEVFQAKMGCIIIQSSHCCTCILKQGINLVATARANVSRSNDATIANYWPGQRGATAFEFVSLLHFLYFSPQLYSKHLFSQYQPRQHKNVTSTVFHHFPFLEANRCTYRTVHNINVHKRGNLKYGLFCLCDAI